MREKMSSFLLIKGILMVVVIITMIICSIFFPKNNEELTAEREAYKAISRESVNEKEKSIKEGRLEAISKLEKID